MSEVVHLRALTVIKLGEHRALLGQRFIINIPAAAQLIRLGKAVLVDELDLGRIAGREIELQMSINRRH